MIITEFITYINEFWLNINLHPIWLFILLFTISMSKSTVILSSFLPPASVILLTGITVSLQKLNVGLISLAIMLGATTGSIISYFLGNQITKKKLFSRFLNRYENIINSAYYKLQNQGITVLFTSRFIAVLRYMIPLVAGMLLMNKNKVYSIFLLSSFVWSGIFILIVKCMSIIITSKTFI
ncbi:MAG: DedA family protein [Arsenophonus endosymbiont of Ceratovacuna japonica]